MVMDEARKLELIYQFALTYAATFISLFVAAGFGLFSVLIMLSMVPILSVSWLLLSATYFLIVLATLYLYLRTLLYTQLAVETGKRLELLGEAEQLYKKAAEQGSLLVKLVYKVNPSIYRPSMAYLTVPAVIFTVVLYIAVNIK